MITIDYYCADEKTFKRHHADMIIISENGNEIKTFKNTYIYSDNDYYIFYNNKVRCNYYIAGSLIFYEIYINKKFYNDDGPRLVLVSKISFIQETFNINYTEEYCFEPNGKVFFNLNLYTKEDILNFRILE